MSYGDRSEDAELRVTAILEGQRVHGVLKSYNSNNGYGFITCTETFELFKADVYLAKRQVDHSGATVGASLSFNVVLTKDGKPQARNVEVEIPGPPASPSHHRRASDGSSTGAPSFAGHSYGAWGHRRYDGTIKSFGKNTGVGFIECPELRGSPTGSEVLVDKTQIGKFEVNDQVRFSLHYDSVQERPRAINLEPVTGGSWNGMPAMDPWSSWAAANPMGMAAMNPMGHFGAMGFNGYDMGMAYGMPPFNMAAFGMPPFGMPAASSSRSKRRRKNRSRSSAEDRPRKRDAKRSRSRSRGRNGGASPSFGSDDL